MMKRVLRLDTIGSLLVALFFLAVGPVWGQGVDDRILNLERELSQLKAQQIEMKKEATAAQDKLPTFSYRAGSGLLVEAPDKSWSIRFANRFNAWILFREGRDHVRGGTGELFVRRLRPRFVYCVNNCFYELEYALDEDGFLSHSELQDGSIYFHFEQINPWLPTFNMGMETGNEWARRRSSSSDAVLDFDMLSRSNGYNTGSQSWAYVFTWEDKPLFGVGTLGWFGFSVGAGPATSGEGQGRFSDNKDYVVSIGIEPFSEVKSKWISGLEYSFGAWFCNYDSNGRVVDQEGVFHEEGGGHQDSPEGCTEARIRETDGPERANIWRHRIDGNGDRDGMNHFLMNSLRWRIGVYQLLATLGFQRYEGTPVRHRNFYIAHSMYVWSPKGFMTGSSSTPGSVLIGTHFERSDGHCRSETADTDKWCRNDDEFENNHATINSASLYYVIQRGMRIGGHWNHYNAKKLTTAVQNDLDISGTSWDNFFLIFDWNF